MIEANLAINTITGFSPGTWTPLASDTIARYDHAMAHYNGELFIFGGRNSSGVLNTIRKYNIATNTWSAIATVLPTVRQGFTAITIDSKIYLYGGLNGATKYGDLYAFDPVTNALTTLASGLACNGHAAVAYDGDLYVFGGQPTSTATPPVNTLRKYTVSTNAWSTIATTGETPNGRFYTAFGISNNKFYIAGGSSGSSEVVVGMDVYEFATNRWLPKVQIQANGLGFGSVGTGDRLYAIAGALGNPTPSLYSDVARVYDTVQEKWGTIAKYPANIGYLACCAVGNDVYAMGGYTQANTIQATLYRFSP